MQTQSKGVLYWTAKGFISFFMFFSAYYSYSHAEALRALGFPDYFRIELVVAKIIGGILLLYTGTPARVKEWIYAGFGISMISAFTAHICSGDPLSQILFVFIDFILIAICIEYVHRKENVSLKHSPK